MPSVPPRTVTDFGGAGMDFSGSETRNDEVRGGGVELGFKGSKLGGVLEPAPPDFVDDAVSERI